MLHKTKLPHVLTTAMLCRMVGLRPAGFGIFIGLLMFEALIAITVGLCVSAAVPTVGTYPTLLYS